MSNIAIRKATPDDAPVLRRVYEYASHGLSHYLWQQDYDGRQEFDAFVWERMRRKIADPKQHFAVAEVDGVPAGGILTHDINAPESLDGHNEIIRAFVVVENDLVGTRYVNALATFPAFRRLGIASRLLNHATVQAAEANRALSLSVCDENPDAIRTYHANGFSFIGARPMEKGDWQGEGEAWLQMVNESLIDWKAPVAA